MTNISAKTKVIINVPDCLQYAFASFQQYHEMSDGFLGLGPNIEASSCTCNKSTHAKIACKHVGSNDKKESCYKGRFIPPSFTSVNFLGLLQQTLYSYSKKVNKILCMLMRWSEAWGYSGPQINVMLAQGNARTRLSFLWHYCFMRYYLSYRW
jgi:hypothetical protein